MDWKTFFFSLRGRISRMPFWIGILVLSAVIWGPLLPFGDMLPPNVPPASYGSLLEASALLWLILLVFLDIPIGVKRLHDLGMSGWWFLFKFIPIGNLLFLLMLGVLKETSGSNRFGPDPLGRRNIPDAQFQ